MDSCLTCCDSRMHNAFLTILSSGEIQFRIGMCDSVPTSILAGEMTGNKVGLCILNITRRYTARGSTYVAQLIHEKDIFQSEIVYITSIRMVLS